MGKDLEVSAFWICLGNDLKYYIILWSPLISLKGLYHYDARYFVCGILTTGTDNLIIKVINVQIFTI